MRYFKIVQSGHTVGYQFEVSIPSDDRFSIFKTSTLIKEKKIIELGAQQLTSDEGLC